MKIDRLISIIMVLLNQERISAGELAEKFEVSSRTIYRDIETLSQAGIPITAYPGVNGGIGIMPEYKVDKRMFTAADISTLLIGLNSLSTTISQKELLDTLEKVKGLIPKEQMKEIESRSNRIAIDLTTWVGSRDFQPDLLIIKTALQENKCLTFRYINNNGDKSSRVVEPYQLILKEGHWYLQGYCRNRNDFRVFKLSRISGLDLMDIAFLPREYPTKPLAETDWIKSRMVSIKLLVDNSLMERITERFGPDCIKPYGEHRFLADFPFAEDDYGYSLLLSFGDKCECISPEHIRRELAVRIRRMADIYGDEVLK